MANSSATCAMSTDGMPHTIKATCGTHLHLHAVCQPVRLRKINCSDAVQTQLQHTVCQPATCGVGPADKLQGRHNICAGSDVNQRPAIGNCRPRSRRDAHEPVWKVRVRIQLPVPHHQHGKGPRAVREPFRGRPVQLQRCSVRLSGLLLLANELGRAFQWRLPEWARHMVCCDLNPVQTLIRGLGAGGLGWRSPILWCLGTGGPGRLAGVVWCLGDHPDQEWVSGCGFLGAWGPQPRVAGKGPLVLLGPLVC
jgi:hypothetical protein